MCGIAGFVGRGDLSGELLRTMTEALAHRGPDAHGYHLDRLRDGTLVGLGHRRLSIIDLSSAARQPLANEDETVLVICNGEIYNFLALREELLARGHRFRSGSDSEVILHAYEEHGIGCLERLNGMFAFALWDARAERLLLARDRMGVKPLVYAADVDGVRFASELAGLMPGLPTRDLDLEGLSQYLTFKFVPAPYTIYSGIRKLSPGHVLVWERGRVTVEPYWQLEPGEPMRDPREATAALRDVLEDATRIRMTSDVPLGAFLSGGIDSSAVVGLMSRLAPEPVHTFHVSFEGAGRRGVGDERGYARAVAARAGTHHHELVVTQRQAIDELPAILDALAEPLGTDSFVPTYLLAEAARQHVTVALSGDGPDELFGGYGIHRAEAAYQLLQALPRVLHAHVLPPLAAWLPASGEGPFSIRVRRLQRLLSGAAGDAPERYFRWLRLWPDERRRTLLAGGILSDDGEERARELVRREMTRFPLDPTNNLLFFDARVRLPNHVLMKVDLASMRHALEVRSPFLDYRVAELAFRIGGRAKVRGNRGKRLLVDAVRDLLPPHVSGRGKQGFDLPVGQWLRRELAPLYRDVVTRDRLRTMGILNAEAVERLYREHCAGWRDHSWTLWTVLVLCWWWFSPHGPSGSGVATHPPLRVVA